MILLSSGLICLLALSGCVNGRSVRHHNAQHTSETKAILSSNFIGEATNDLATAMLQESLEEDGNYVFSPIGYSTILAILAEGARGDTRAQLATGLHFPEDLAAVRQAYKSLLQRMKEKGDNKPEFKNWFYAYRNYSIQSQYRQILLENYLTEVKAVEFDYYDNNTDEDLFSIDKKKDAIKELVKEKVDEKVTEDDKINKIHNDENADKVSVVENKDEEPKVEQKVEDKVEDSKVDKKEEAPAVAETEKKDEVTVEKEVTEKEVPLSDDKNEVSTDATSEKAPQVVEQVKVEEISTEVTSTVAEVSSQPPKEQESSSQSTTEDSTKKENQVETGERKMGYTRKVKGRRYFLNKDTVTALTANRLSSNRKTEGEGENANKKIIIFNGFYYKGNWSVQFQAKKDDSPEGKTFFYTSESEKKPAKMMHTTGEFEIGQVPELESTALEVPYEGNKYSLLILLPNNRSGLKKLASDLGSFSLPKIDQYLTKKQVQVCLPKVNFYTISKPKAALLKSGVKNLFNKDADLTGINNEGGLYLDELVQLVTMNFEETSTETNFLTSSLAVTRSATTDPEPFIANHPFFFFLRDRQDGIILAAGKLQDPTKTSH